MNTMGTRGLVRTSSLWLLIWLNAPALLALTLEELRATHQLTPARFARQFANFKFERHDQVQAPQMFLAHQAGDCDDYATLAAEVLREKGYTTRLVSVRMAEDIHVVCYIEETRCYLDFNNRIYLVKTVSSDGSLKDIANKVAKSFDTRWFSASEFTFRDGSKRRGHTIARDGSTLIAALK
jgi:hypothetical protein